MTIQDRSMSLREQLGRDFEITYVKTYIHIFDITKLLLTINKDYFDDRILKFIWVHKYGNSVVYRSIASDKLFIIIYINSILIAQ